MSDTSDQKGYFNPLHEAHSIEQVLFTVQVERPLTDEALSKARQIAAVFKTTSELPAIRELQGFTINLGVGAPMPIHNGFMLYRTGPDGAPEKELRVERNSITFRTMSYSRWANIWDEAKKYLAPVIPIFLDSNRVTGISLNIFDKFIWHGNKETCRAEYLLSSESKYICHHIFESEDLWHSHTGSFIKINDQTKRLININIDSLDESQDNDSNRIIMIATVLSDLLNQPGYQTFELDQINAVEEIQSKFHELHKFANDSFKNIINTEIGKRIALIG